jgi:hypothetical protein
VPETEPKGVLQRLTDALFDAEPIGPAPRPADDDHLRETKRAEATHAFETRLDQLLTDRRPVVAGRLHTIDLSDVRRRFGARWQQVAHRAMDLAAGVIERRLAPSDVMAPVDDSGFLVLFAELSETEAAFKASVLGREIRELLLGEFPADSLTFIPPAVTVIEASATGQMPTTISDLAQRFQAVPAPPPRIADPIPDLIPAADPPRPDVMVSFRPLWFRTKGVVPSFQARLTRRDPTGSVREGAPAYRTGPGLPSLQELDRQVLALGLLDHRRLIQGAGRSVLVVPIHASSLLDHLGFKLIDLIRLQSDVQRRFLMVELRDPTHRLTSDQLGEAVRRLGSLVRGTVAATDIDRAQRAGCQGVVLDLEETPIAAEVLATRLSAWVKAAHSHRLTTTVHGLSTPAQLTAALSAGCDFLAGPAVAPDEDALQAAHTFRLPTPG